MSQDYDQIILYSISLENVYQYTSANVHDWISMWIDHFMELGCYPQRRLFMSYVQLKSKIHRWILLGL